MMNAYDAPKEKKISRKALDSALNSWLTENSFQIEIPAGDKTLTVDFKRFISPVQLGGFERQAASTAIRKDPESGGMLFDRPALELSIHHYILTALSSFPVPVEVDENGEESIDVIAMGIYGVYFRSISEDYENMFTTLYLQCEQVVQEKLVNYERMTSWALQSMSVADTLTPLATVLKDISTNQTPEPEKRDAVLPFPPQDTVTE